MTATAILSPIKPCVKCGAVDRKNNGNCRPCAKAYSVKYRSANRAALCLKSKIYDLANKDKKQLTAAAYYAENSQRIKERDSKEIITKRNATYYKNNTLRVQQANNQWSKNNRWSARVRKQNRRARIKGAGGVLSKGLADKLFDLQQGKCACCKASLGKNFHLDHIMPLALGGENADCNMQLLRQRCNTQKKAKHPVDFMQSRGFLL